MKMIIIMTIMMVCFCGCSPARPIWGQGDPPAQWQSFFGNDNGSRMDFVQTQTINKQGQTIDDLVERVLKLEGVQDANEGGK